MSQLFALQASRARRVDQQPAVLDGVASAVRHRRCRRKRRRRNRATRRRAPRQRDSSDCAQDARQAAPPVQAEPFEGRLDAGSGLDVPAL